MSPTFKCAPPAQLLMSDSDDGDDGGAEGHCHTADLSDSIFKSHIQTSGHSSPDLSKIQSFLTSSCSGALSCLICLEKIRLTDPTWSCFSSCFDVFHLLCVQSWARQSSDLSASRAASRLSADVFPAAAAKAIEDSVWNCPKCRVEYSKSEIPKVYFCFCGKVENPVNDPWILPHSCGEICGRPLRHDCGHHCLLLCHPGPCPSCPKLVKVKCFCGGVNDVRRCGFKDFSCHGPCLKLLACGVHSCPETCHEGSCPPCRVVEVYQCRCGKREEERECYDRDFRCDIPCERQLECGKHVCGKGCHAGQCGECPFQGKRTCPCGNRIHEGLACDVMVPLCGATCDKMLSCGIHRCPERCHRGACVENCRAVITKQCRCGSLRKGVPCYQDLSCERKCQILRDCERHACKRRCCDGNCPPCSEICNRKLRCRNHKCPSPCHRGPCAPCPIIVKISCSCGATRFEVPCGTEKEQKPPRCPKPCRIISLCKHASNMKPHRCHYGACPPCQLICDEEFSCGHRCKLRCHGPRPPPNLEFTLKPKKPKSNYQVECNPGAPCPPCPELVWRSCVGEHIGAERMMVCSDRSLFSCENYCGNILPCGNHYCTKPCHATMDIFSDFFPPRKGEPCEECDLPCQKEKNPACPHPCPRLCHPGVCPPCKVLVKRSCHCGSMIHVFECTYYNSLSEKEQMDVRSCHGPCHRKLPNCSHLCPRLCHPGQCPSPEKCSKKVTVRCGCQMLKKEWLCHDVQKAHLYAGSDLNDKSKSHFGLGLIPCNSDCKNKAKISDSELQYRKPKDLEGKVESTADKKGKRKRHERVKPNKEISKLQRAIDAMGKLLMSAALLVFVIAAAYYGYDCLLWLSDWMNELEERREREGYPRI